MDGAAAAAMEGGDGGDRRLSGFYKGVPKVRYVDAGRPVPTPKYRTDWNVFRNLRLTLYALAALLTSSQGAQLTRPSVVSI